MKVIPLAETWNYTSFTFFPSFTLESFTIPDQKAPHNFIMVHHKGELQFPDNYTDTATKKFLKDYFESSNTPNAHEETGSYFTENGVFCIGPEKARGLLRVSKFCFSPLSLSNPRNPRATRENVGQRAKTRAPCPPHLPLPNQQGDQERGVYGLRDSCCNGRKHSID